MGARRSAIAAACLAAGLAAGGCKSSSGGGPTDGATDGPKQGCPPVPDDLISNFELDNGLAPVGGRQGGWYTYGDDVGSFATASGFDIDFANGNPNCSPDASLHLKGTGFSMWGAATGVDWKPRPSDGDGGYGDKMTYDASGYRGVAFWAKASAPLDGVQASFPDLYTDKAAPKHDMPNPTDPSMFECMDCTCEYAAGFPNNCSPYLVKFGLKGDAAADTLFSGYASYQLDTTWKRFQVLFVDTRQDPGNGGYHPPGDRLTADKLTAMAIQINADYATGLPVARDFEIWIDDVYFIK
jgi:hypothetical protein